MLVQRRGLWTSIKPALVQGVVFSRLFYSTSGLVVKTITRGINHFTPFTNGLVADLQLVVVENVAVLTCIVVRRQYCRVIDGCVGVSSFIKT